jgi:hypothetical protein
VSAEEKFSIEYWKYFVQRKGPHEAELVFFAEIHGPDEPCAVDILLVAPDREERLIHQDPGFQAVPEGGILQVTCPLQEHETENCAVRLLVNGEHLGDFFPSESRE